MNDRPRRSNNPIETIKRRDGTRAVYYFGQYVGDFARVTYLPDNSRRWRGLSVHGQVIYARTEAGAASALMAAYH